MRTLLIITMLCSAGAARANDTLWLSLWRKAPVVVQAKIIERGRCVRMETCECEITCVVQYSYKGKVADGDTIKIQVLESGNIPLGGKLLAYDTVRYEAGKEFVFFLKGGRFNPFTEDTWYMPVDDWNGALVPTMGLQTWLVNDVGDPR